MRFVGKDFDAVCITCCTLIKCSKSSVGRTLMRSRIYSLLLGVIPRSLPDRWMLRRDLALRSAEPMPITINSVRLQLVRSMCRMFLFLLMMVPICSRSCCWSTMDVSEFVMLFQLKFRYCRRLLAAISAIRDFTWRGTREFQLISRSTK